MGGAQRAAPPPIVVVNHESDCHPHEESNPVRNRQASHEQQASNYGDDRCERAAGGAKGAWTVGLAVTKNQHSRGYKREGKKRADIGEIGERSDVEKTGGNDDEKTSHPRVKILRADEGGTTARDDEEEADAD